MFIKRSLSIKSQFSEYEVEEFSFDESFCKAENMVDRLLLRSERIGQKQ